MRDRVGLVLSGLGVVLSLCGIALALIVMTGCHGDSDRPGVEEFNVTCGSMCYECAGGGDRWVTAAVYPAREFEHCPDIVASEPGLCYQPVAGIGNVCFYECDGSTACVVPPLPLPYHPVIQ